MPKIITNAKEAAALVQEKQQLEVNLAWELLDVFNKTKDLIDPLRDCADLALQEMICIRDGIGPAAVQNAINEEIAEEETASPASLDIDSLAEKLQSAEKIVPQENYQPQNPVPKETQDDQAYETDAVTPTLAEIYASQGEYRAAIQAYEILMFSVPAKGADYQARIRQLQQMQMEKDGLI